jgi:hypothetical protein
MYKDQKPTREATPLPRSPLAEKHGIDAFALFCAYYLGITASDGYEFQNVHQVAKRFGVPSGIIKQALQDFGMDTDRMVQSDFDLSSAQIDVLEVPDGVSRTEVARAHWEAWRSAKAKPRDWQRELATDARENEKTFGPRAPQRSGRR